MHARIDELLSLRDGEPADAEVARHVSSCPVCESRLQDTIALRGRLRGLATAPAASGGWELVRGRLGERRRQRQRRRRQARLVAAGAILAIVAMLGSRLGQPDRDATTAAVDAGDLTAPGAARPLSLEELRGRSQALEALLAAMPERPAVERADTAVPIDDLEARVQWLDHELSLGGAGGDTQTEVDVLWRDRVEVMDALVRLRLVEAQRLAL